MRKIFFIGIIALGLNSFAQTKIEVKEQTEDIAGGNHNALVTKIYQSKEEDVMKEWKSLMKDFDAKVTVKKDMFADNAMIKDMTTNFVDIYANAETNSDGDVILRVAFDLGGAYLSSSQHPKEYKEARRIIQEFAYDLSEKGFKERVKMEEKNLAGMQKAIDAMAKDTEKKKEEIETYKEKITQNEAAIKKNSDDAILKNKELEDQKKLLEQFKKKSELSR